MRGWAPVFALVLAAQTAAPGRAHADANDIVLARLAARSVNGQGQTVITPDNTAFRSLASELGFVLAPHLLAPADTLGWGGFELSVEATNTTIDTGGTYWRALEGSHDPTGMTGPFAPSSLSTLGFFVRKGVWFPVPSFEFGAGATHLGTSSTWTGQLYGKLAIAEGYHELPLPSLAVRGAVSRMMTQRELDLTVASFDVSISKHVGVGGTWRWDPYIGYELLTIIPRSGVIDPTPNVDPLQDPADAKLNFVFKDQQDIFRNVVFGGMKLQYYVFQLTVEAQFASAGSSNDDRAAILAKDTAKAQRTLALSAGFAF